MFDLEQDKQMRWIFLSRNVTLSRPAVRRGEGGGGKRQTSAAEDGTEARNGRREEQAGGGQRTGAAAGSWSIQVHDWEQTPAAGRTGSYQGQQVVVIDMTKKKRSSWCNMKIKSFEQVAHSLALVTRASGSSAGTTETAKTCLAKRPTGLRTA